MLQQNLYNIFILYIYIVLFLAAIAATDKSMNVVGIKSENESLTALYLSRYVYVRERERERERATYMRSIRFDDAARQCAAFYYVARTAAGAHSAGVFVCL